MCFSCSTEAGQQAHEFFEIIGYWSFKIDNDLDPKKCRYEFLFDNYNDYSKGLI